MRVSPRHILAIAVSSLALVVATGVRSRGAVQPAVTTKPNIVVIMVDDLDSRGFARALSLGLMPNTKAAIVNRGITFSNSFVTNSLCCPSRATYLTGQYAHNHHVKSNAPTNGAVIHLDDSSTIAASLHSGGYRTRMVGKYLNYYGISDINHDGTVNLADAVYIPPGWDHWQALIDPSTYLMYKYAINDNGTIVRYGDAEADYQTDVLAARAEHFIDEAEANDAAPFFLTIWPLAPHVELFKGMPWKTMADVWRWTLRPAPKYAGTVTAPLPELPSFNEADISDKPAWFSDFYTPLSTEDLANGQRKYEDRLASMRSVDDLVGTVVKALVRNGEYQNTVIVFTSDNGFLLGEHRLPEKL